DGNGEADAFSDGLILIRYLFGLRGPALTAGILGPGATRTAAQIESYISLIRPEPRLWPNTAAERVANISANAP
ncbi:MAG: hypothetical protein ABIS68_12335, partial [Casimicrobiaceae bacterium]